MLSHPDSLICCLPKPATYIAHAKMSKRHKTLQIKQLFHELFDKRNRSQAITTFGST
jgi:hypothetical protein